MTGWTITAPRPAGGVLPRPATRFELPPGRWATGPPEHQGLRRDGVRLLVARPDGVVHARFADLDRHLDPGDVVVVNTSATRPAAIAGRLGGDAVVLHLAGPAPADGPTEPGAWVVELRRDDGAHPHLDAAVGDVVELAGGARAHLRHARAHGPGGRGTRLWLADLEVPGGDPDAHLAAHGRPISYDGRHVPLADRQTVFARHPGSAEMASAGRPFSGDLLARLVAAGVHVAPITLHAGVSSQEAGEPPQPEWIDVPGPTAHLVEVARDRGSRVVAVGTTVTRALESAVCGGRVVPTRGWTDLVVTPDRGVQVVDGLITGWHEADASHLLLLEAVAGADLVRRAYEAALSGSYLWHEFGDSCLLLPG